MNYHISWESTYEKERIITDSMTIKEKFTLYLSIIKTQEPQTLFSHLTIQTQGVIIWMKM